MGTYLNPGNSGFADICKARYIDKTGMISVINQTISTPQKLTCVSRPRRFGKSFAAQMLCAYYDRTVDSHALFDGLEIAGSESYEEHLNRYDVIYLNMTDIKPFAKYVGFTEAEVRDLCGEYGVSFAGMKRWYDGYELRGVGPVYNPNSVMRALRSGTFDSYWSQTSAADNLLDYISRDVDGLRQVIAELMGGVEVEIDTLWYNNDLTYINRDAALTMLVHLGYLSYDQETGRVRIPNEEVRLEFVRTLRQDRNPETMRRVRESDQLIMDTIHGEEEKVAAQIRKVHMETTNPLNANREDSLRAVIQVAYFVYKDYYIKLQELPTGRGYADIVYLPKPGKGVPALVVELKWNRDAVGAIRQIKQKDYPAALAGYGGELLLVGISYEKGRDAYECTIERWEGAE